MRVPRRYILEDGCYAHITWRCFEQRHYLKSDDVKRFIETTWKAYKQKYKLKIFDYTIMDNHVHLVVRVTSLKGLSDFMRTTNSVIARFINRRFGRKGYVLEGRYYSPVIENEQYLINTLKYIWMNRFRATKCDPRDYRFCSLYYRYRGIKNALLDSYKELPISCGASQRDFVKRLLKDALERVLSPEVYEHGYSIGGISFVMQRIYKIREHFRQYRSQHGVSPPLAASP